MANIAPATGPGSDPSAAAPAGRPDRDTPAALTEEIVSTIVGIVSSIRCVGSGRLVKLGVSMTHLHVLWMLQHHGALPMSRMADLLDVSVSNATGIIDRMEERGLVERARVPGDRRVVLVQLADGGQRAIEEIEAVRQDRLSSILGHLAPAQLACLAEAFADIRKVLEADEALAHEGHTHSHA
ncbi:MAG: MarR family transcriptional regulator [Chloroflexi bacterium]|nr:MarR family transcriptional regulator [Chloroflexota bacterium]